MIRYRKINETLSYNIPKFKNFTREDHYTYAGASEDAQISELYFSNDDISVDLIWEPMDDTLTVISTDDFGSEEGIFENVINRDLLSLQIYTRLKREEDNLSLSMRTIRTILKEFGAIKIQSQ